MSFGSDVAKLVVELEKQAALPPWLTGAAQSVGGMLGRAGGAIGEMAGKVPGMVGKIPGAQMVGDAIGTGAGNLKGFAGDIGGAFTGARAAGRPAYNQMRNNLTAAHTSRAMAHNMADSPLEAAYRKSMANESLRDAAGNLMQSGKDTGKTFLSGVGKAYSNRPVTGALATGVPIAAGAGAYGLSQMGGSSQAAPPSPGAGASLAGGAGAGAVKGPAMAPEATAAPTAAAGGPAPAGAAGVAGGAPPADPGTMARVMKWIEDNPGWAAGIGLGGAAGLYGLSQMMGNDDEEEKFGSVMAKRAMAPPAPATAQAPAAPSPQPPPMPPGPAVARQQAATAQRAASRQKTAGAPQKGFPKASRRK